MWCKKSAQASAIDDAKNKAQAVVDEARERYEDARDRAGEVAEQAQGEIAARAHDWKGNVADAAAHAWEIVAQKASELAGDLSVRAGEAARQAQEVARAKAEVAGAAAHQKWDEVSHDRLEPAQKVAQAKFAEVSATARDHWDDVSQRAAEAARLAAREAAQRASAKAKEVAEVAPGATQAALQNATIKAGKLGIAAGKALHDRAAQYVPDYVPEVKIVEKKGDLSTKLLWLGVGLFAGAALALLLTPNSGRRNRAAVKDKLAKASHEASDLGHTAAQKASDLSHRAAGAAHTLKDRVHPAPDDADDATIEARVRSALGSNAATRDLERLNIEVIDGVVTLHGPMVDAATSATIKTAIRAVKGVRDVKSNLLVETNEEEQAFVG